MRVLSLCLHPHAEPAQMPPRLTTRVQPVHRVCYPWGVTCKRVTLKCNKMQRVHLVCDDEASVLNHPIRGLTPEGYQTRARSFHLLGARNPETDLAASSPASASP